MPRTIVRRKPSAGSAWPLIVTMASVTGTLAIASLFFAHNHDWTDQFMGRLPLPGPRTSLAADPALFAQLRTIRQSARFARLSDQTLVLVVEATVVNDSLVPVSHVVVEATAFAGEKIVGRTDGECGKEVSGTLLRRMPLRELAALAGIAADPPLVLPPGEQMRCQVVLARIAEETSEVAVRIASAEPALNHSLASSRP